MKHSIQHQVTIDGILYKTLEEKEFNAAVDFYFDVFLKGKYDS